MNRTVSWFSCGAASAVATKLALREGPVTIAYCETGAEHEDNSRFMVDCENWFGQPVERLKSERYADTWDVFEKRRYLAGIEGALCTTELKVMPRLAWQRPDDIHVFGYTNDARDVARAERLVANYPEMRIRAPLINRGLTKAACLAIIEGAGIEVPAMYRLGFQNNNCIPCVKATSAAYWALVRLRFPQKFQRMAELSRALDVRLTRLKGVRVFIDELPLDHPTGNPIAPSCDFLCSLIEQEMEEAQP